MGKYIDAKEFWNRLISVSENDWVGFDTIDEILSEMSSVDVVEVVRCKDCKHWSANTGLPFMSCDKGIINSAFNKGFAFCSYGERKDG